MSTNLRRLETRRIIELTNELTKKGYNVIVEPNDQELPEFLRGTQPDLIALREDENLVIEVMASGSHRNRKQLETLAELANRPGWRFDLEVFRADQAQEEEQSRPSSDDTLSEDEIRAQVKQAEVLIGQGLNSPALVMLWGGLEAALRRRVPQEELSRIRGPEGYIKAAHSRGILDYETYHFLRGAFRERSKIVHGYTSRKIDIFNNRRLVEVVKRLLER